MEKTRSSEMKDKKIKEQGEQTRRDQRIQEKFSQLQNTNFQTERSPQCQLIDENRFTKVTSLKNVRTGVTRKILKGSRENKTSLIQKNQKPEWHQTSTVTLEARRQKNNIFEILRQHNFQSKILHPGKY